MGQRRPRRRPHRPRRPRGRPRTRPAAPAAWRLGAPPPRTDRNTLDGARDNIQRHYDLSNDLFALFLDPSLSYSSAVFDTLPATPRDLTAAQHRKIDRLLDLAGVGPGTRLLEIGTGWGELAIRAAPRRHVPTITLSAEQRELARHRIADAGLGRPATSDCATTGRSRAASTRSSASR